MVRRGIPMSPMTYAWSCPWEMEFPYPAIAPSNTWWPASTLPTAAAGHGATEREQQLAADNAALRARVAELELALAQGHVATAA